MTPPSEQTLYYLLKPYAARLASFIDAIAGGHPLVSGLPKNVAVGILWQYGDYDFIIHTSEKKRRFPSPESFLGCRPVCNAIHLLSIEEALRLIEMTEAIRQDTALPMVYLGRMLGTVFSSDPKQKLPPSHELGKDFQLAELA